MSPLALLAQSQVQTYWRLNRLTALPEGWHWFAIAALILLVSAYIVWMYRRDGVDLSRGVRWSLVVLRLFAVAALVFFFLDLEKGSERQHVKESRVLVLADTSLSMATPDAQDGGDAQKRRVDALVELIENEELVQDLRQQHDLLVYRFDAKPEPEMVASLPKLVASEDSSAARAARLQQRRQEFEQAREKMQYAMVATAIGFVLLLAGAALSVTAIPRELRGWLTFASVLVLAGGSSVAFTVHLQNSDFSFRSLLGWESLADSEAARDDAQEPPANESDSEQPEEERAANPAEIQWAEEFKPQGVESRLGDAILALVNQERGGPIAGVILVSDGGQNSGVDPATATLAAKDAGIRVFAIGLGSDERAKNVRVVDMDAPKRAYPRDEFPLTGYVQAYGMEGRSLTVELYAIEQTGEPAADKERIKDPPIDALVADAQVTLEGDGSVTPVRFQTSQEEEGRFAYVMRITAPQDDSEAEDNLKSSLVEVIDQKTKVLLMAGGPSREFRFLRNQLFRDQDITSHVWLQSGRPGMSQEADELLFEFPSDPDSLYQYDAIIAFDPDWLQLNEDQLELLERWVAEKAGGLIVVAGPVNTPRWANLTREGDARIATIKALYPVVFYSWRSATLSLGRFGGVAAWPLKFTQDGLDAEFLWLAEDAIASEAAWSSFEGVYGYYAVKDPKLGARIYAKFSDPDTALDDELPIYFAGHYYGAGRVFFQASGEMWRLRAIDDTYFQQYYTKLLRWAAQGRLLRDSKHGVLLVDKERCLVGDHLAVSALLYDDQHRPLDRESVTASLASPDGSRVELELKRVKDSARDGMYSAQFTSAMEGDYRVELIPPDSPTQELLTRVIRSRVPALETERPERNDELLSELAQKTNAQYYVGVEAALTDTPTTIPLTAAIERREQVTFLPGVPDSRFAQLLRTWLLIVVSASLCLEWITRRLCKLA